jgi:hypothetical protein
MRIQIRNEYLNAGVRLRREREGDRGRGMLETRKTKGEDGGEKRTQEGLTVKRWEMDLSLTIP